MEDFRPSVDYKVRLGQVESEFDWKRPKLTRSVRASKLSVFSTKYNSVSTKQATQKAPNLILRGV